MAHCAEDTARAHQVRTLMRGPPNPEFQMKSLQEIVDERIAEIRTRRAEYGSTAGSDGGSEPES